MKAELIKKITYLILIFIIGAIVGWLYEVIFYYFTENTLLNRGILYGPWLPIYGTGAVLIYLLKPFKKYPLLIFLLVVLITGILEYIIGYIDLYYFNTKLWDYTGLFLNINGFVCLRSVLVFGVGGLMLIYLIDPILNKLTTKISQKNINIICIIFIIIFIMDIILSNIYRTPITY